MEPVNKMWLRTEDFFASFYEGIKLIQGDLVAEAPNEADKETLKSLLALFVGATIEMNPKVLGDSDLDKLVIVKLALVAAYNLGRQYDKIT